MEFQPPKFWLRFFRWYCHPHYVEDLEGDILERFERKIESENFKNAKWGLTLDILKLFRPGIIRPLNQNKQQTQFDMFKNYSKVAWRHILKEKFYSAINITGLAVGITCCLFITLYINFELSYDNYNEKLDRTYRVLQAYRSNDEANGSKASPEEFQVWGCAPIGEALANEFPEIEHVFRFTSPYELLLSYGSNIFQENNIVFADSTAFDVFSWDLIYGDKETALDQPNSIILSKELAYKYFGNSNPLGELMTVDNDESFKVTGVIDLPTNTHFSYDAYVSMGTFRNWRSEIFEWWGYVDFYTYITIRENASLRNLYDNAQAVVDKGTSHWERSTMEVDFEPLAGAYLNSKASRQPGATGSISNLYIFGFIGVFVLLIATINFVNLSTARSVERAKEVGIRKVVGAHKNSLSFQFLFEFITLSLVSAIIAFALAALLNPTFQEVSGKPITLDFLYSLKFILSFLASILIVGVLAGSYPAFLLSQFRPIQVLKGNFKSSSKGIILRKSLVVFQFTLTIALLVGTAVVFSQLNFMQKYDLGFEKNNTIVVDYGYDGHVNRQNLAIKKALSEVNGVISVAASRAVPGDFFPNAGTQIEDMEGIMIGHSPAIYEIDPDFIPNYKIELAAGRFFVHGDSTDINNALMINEAAARLYGYNNPEDVIGKKFEQWGKNGEVIGVVKDFNYESLHTDVQPLTLRFEPWSMSKFSIKIANENVSATLEALNEKWKELIPDRPFNYTFLSTTFNDQYQSDGQFGKVFGGFAALAIGIAFLGLLGLTTYSTTQRTKEIGIRKILGASVNKIVLLFAKDFSYLLIIAFLVALPLSWLFIQNWLKDFAYKVNIGAEIYFMAGIAVALLALFTISWQSIRVATQNPVDSIRNE